MTINDIREKLELPVPADEDDPTDRIINAAISEAILSTPGDEEAVLANVRDAADKIGGGS